MSRKIAVFTLGAAVVLLAVTAGIVDKVGSKDQSAFTEGSPMNIKVTPGRTIIGRLAKGEDLLTGLENCARQHGITLGAVQAIGAVTQARIAYYDQTARKYNFLDLPRPLEITSLIGNISLKDGKTMIHAHITLADSAGRGSGGHLAEGTKVFACEFILQEYQSDTPLVRRLDPATGLTLWR